MHHSREKRVNKIQDGFAASEIVHQRHCLTQPVAPGARVFLKNVRIRQPKPINALLYVAHQKSVGCRAFAAERFDDSILRCVNVLIFVHKNILKFLPPLAGDRGRLAGSVVPEQSQGVLLQVVKIQHSQFAFVFGEGITKLAGQFQQRFHLAPGPLPVLG